MNWHVLISRTRLKYDAKLGGKKNCSKRADIMNYFIVPNVNNANCFILFLFFSSDERSYDALRFVCVFYRLA